MQFFSVSLFIQVLPRRQSKLLLNQLLYNNIHMQVLLYLRLFQFTALFLMQSAAFKLIFTFSHTSSWLIIVYYAFHLNLNCPLYSNLTVISWQDLCLRQYLSLAKHFTDGKCELCQSFPVLHYVRLMWSWVTGVTPETPICVFSVLHQRFIFKLQVLC